MFKEKRLIKRKIDRSKKLPQESIASFVYGTFLVAGGIAATIYFCIDFYQGDIDFISIAGFLLSIISGITGYHLIEKANRDK
jgi:cytochrome c biogenesis protein CcdA